MQNSYSAFDCIVKIEVTNMKYYYEIPGLDISKHYFAVPILNDGLEIAILTKEMIDNIYEKIITHASNPEVIDDKDIQHKYSAFLKYLLSVPEMEYVNGCGVWCVAGRIGSNWSVQEGNVLIVANMLEYIDGDNWLIKYSSAVLKEVKNDESISNYKIVKRRTLFEE